MAEMDDRMARALDVALEYIEYNNMIEDRPTLLRARLVCRSWRTSMLFSGKITTVTLHSLEDLQLAAALVSSTPHQRPPRSSVAESRPFPNLITLNVPESLAFEIGKSPASLHLLASMKDIHVQVLDMYVDAGDLDQASALANLAMIHCPSKLTWAGSLRGLPVNAAAFLDLAWLRLVEISSGDIRQVRLLSTLKSLRTIQLPRSLLPVGGEVSFCFYCELPQLDRLEFTDGDFHWEVEGATSLMQRLDLMDSWKEFIFHFFGMECCLDYSFDWCWHYLSVSQGVVRPVVRPDRCECLLRLRLVSSFAALEISNMLEFGVYASHLALEMHGGCSREFMVHMKYGEHSRDPGCFVDFKRDSAASSGPAGDDPHDLGAGLGSPNPADHPTAPFFVTEKRVAMKASLFDFTVECDGVYELNRQAEQLPALFPNLQTLSIYASCGKCPFANHLHRFSKLTSLSLTVEYSNGPDRPPPPPPLPSSLKQLSISAYELGSTIQSLTNLRHLAILTVTACPTLEIELSSCDVSPLSSLRKLLSLTLTLPLYAGTALIGAETLTNLDRLVVECASDSLEDLSKLGSLRQLKYLRYSVCKALPKEAECEVISSFRDLKQELGIRMPLTDVKIVVNQTEVKLTTTVLP